MDIDVGHPAHRPGQVGGGAFVSAECHLEHAAGVPYPDRAVAIDGVPTPGGGRSCDAPGATGQSLPGAALPHPEVEIVAIRVGEDGDPLDVDPAGVGGLELRPERRDLDTRGVRAEENEMRVAHVHRAGPTVVELLSLVGSE